MSPKKMNKEPHWITSELDVTYDKRRNHALKLFRSVRHGFAHYAIGGLTAAAKTLFQENLKMDIVQDSSTKECKSRIIEMIDA